MPAVLPHPLLSTAADWQSRPLAGRSDNWGSPFSAQGSASGRAFRETVNLARRSRSCTPGLSGGIQATLPSYSFPPTEQERGPTSPEDSPPQSSLSLL